MKLSLRWTCMPMFMLVAAAATAEFHTFRIDEIFSNGDGTVQYVVLHESAGMNGENLLMGQTLVSDSPAAGARTYVFKKNLPGGMCGYYGCMGSPTAHRRVLIATSGFVALGLIAPDYIIPDGFLATGQGSVNYANVDSITYAALPTDGMSGLFRDGTIRLNLATNFAGDTASVTAPGGPATVNVVEYHHGAFDHYFITPGATEQALLDAHAPPFQDWSRTGFSFNAYVNAGAPAGSVVICRFFNDHFFPKSSHFYAAHGFGCEATIAQFPDWKLEDDKLFNTMLPDATTGACPAGTIPVYRMYNQGMGGAPNHRFVTSLAERQKMLDAGFVAEGAGIGVGMCVPG